MLWKQLSGQRPGEYFSICIWYRNKTITTTIRCGYFTSRSQDLKLNIKEIVSAKEQINKNGGLNVNSPAQIAGWKKMHYRKCLLKRKKVKDVRRC